MKDGPPGTFGIRDGHPILTNRQDEPSSPESPSIGDANVISCQIADALAESCLQSTPGVPCEFRRLTAYPGNLWLHRVAARQMA